MLKLADAWWPLALATMAGLSTSLGAIVAVIQKPSAASMAALLGLALGVMATVSCVELVARNAMSGEGDAFLILAAAMSGALAYYMLEPLFPKLDDQHDHLKKQDDIDDHTAFFRQLFPQQQWQQQQSGFDVERSGHGALQRKVITSSAGNYSTATLAGSGATISVMTVAGGGGGGLMRKGSSEASLSTSVAILGPNGRENGSSHGSGQVSGGSGTGGSTALAAEALTAFSPGSQPACGGGGEGGGSVGMSSGPGDVPLLSPASSLGSGLAAAAAGGLRRGPRTGRMLRLGVLMAVTMTLHNLPEGFAVAFSAFTDFGLIMALAIALHNIPEGVIVAAPIYAATGSRWRAIGIATASGLSEPLGALMSLLLLQPFFTSERLHYLLASVGGVMLAVCGIELWPEGRNCRNDRHFAGGILAGSIVMGWTLYVEG